MSAKLDVAALKPKQLAELLAQASGTTITEQQIRDDVAAGAPSNADGTIHLVRFTAWLVGQVR